MKKLHFLLTLVAALGAVMITSCQKEEEKVEFGEAKVTMQKLSTDDFSKMRILFTPTENTSKTAFAIGIEADRESFKNGTIEGLTEQEGNQPFEFIFENLNQDEDYTVFAVAYDENGIAGSIASLKSTPKLGEVNLNMQYLSNNSAGFKYTCESTIASCRYYLGTEADREAFLNEEVESSYLQDIYEEYTINYFDLTPGKEYILFAIAEDIAGMKTELVEIPFTTLSSDDKCPDLAKDIEITDQSAYGTFIKITPNDECGKITAYFCPKGEYDWNIGQWKGDMIEMFDFKGNINEIPSAKDGATLDMEYSNKSLNVVDTDFDLYILFSDNDYNPVCMRKYAINGYTVDANAPAAECTGIEQVELTSKIARFNITLNDAAAGAYYNSIEKSYYDEQMAISQGGEEWIIEFLFTMIQDYMVYGKKTFTFEDTKMEAGQQFYLCVCPFNKNGAQGWGKIYTSDLFTTPMN